MSGRPRNRNLIVALAGMFAAAVTVVITTATSGSPAAFADPVTSTPIKHVVVIYDENVSFDHYFGTYPQALNNAGTTFTAAPGTPAPTNLLSNNSAALNHNPNQYPPRRLTPSEAVTCDQNHSYAPEQKAENNGAMNMFVQNTSRDTCTGQFGSPGLAMDYYDGNTVTAEWNYAQNFAMSDNYFGSTFGPSTPGALNVTAGSTHGVTSVDSVTGAQTATPAGFVRSPNGSGVGTLYGDNDPAYDDCSDNNHTSTNPLASMGGQNIGNLLNTKGVTWGWFQGGFAPTTTAAASSSGYAVCGATHTNIANASSADYSPHHDPFQYFASTSNPHHLPPTSEAAIGTSDQANHQYDLSLFDSTLTDGNLPAVSFLKAPEYQDGHAGYSDPIDEQHFLVQQINAIQQSSYWGSTAIVLTYDDSDGWYDQVASLITNGSDDTNADGQGDTPMCTGVGTVLGGYQDRCGPGPRLPLLVISPYAKQNYVDHTLTTQSSVLKFIEDNWGTGTIGDGSFDATAGSINTMFDFVDTPHDNEVLLAPNGSVQLTPSATTYHPVTPTRIMDSRFGTGGIHGPITANNVFSLKVTGGVVPADATSVVLNVTVANPAAAGNITVFPGETSPPLVSSLNFVKGQDVPNLVIAPVGPNGTVSFINGSPGTVQLIADVTGYFTPTGTDTQGALWSVAPKRLLDTRNGTGAAKAAIAPLHTVTISVAGGEAGVPSGVTAVALNVTETGATGAGFVSAYAAGGTRPNSSNLNFVKGATVPNLVIVPVSSAGQVTLYNGSPTGTVQLIADVQGYFVGSTPATSGAFGALTPYRLLDTRNGTGAAKASIPAHGKVTFTVDGRGGVPSTNVAAAVLNFTVTAPTASGYITAYSGSTQPSVSNLNFVPGLTVANLAIVPMSNGTVTLYNGSPGTVQLIADVSGYILNIPG